MARKHATRRSKTASSTVKISAADIEFARGHAAQALQYFGQIGLAEVRRRALRMLLGAAIPVFGLLCLDWSPLIMLCFLCADLSTTLYADWLRWLLARRWVQASHQRDFEANQVLMIVDGLDDGSGQRVATGKGPASGGLLLFFGTVCSIAMLPLLAVALDRIGISAFQEALDAAWWLLLVGINGSLTLGATLIQSIRIRDSVPGERMLVMESGSITLWWIGMMLLIWLPAQYGMSGLLWMFVILHSVRMGFGIFALYWMPRAVRRIAARHAVDNYSVRALPA